MARRAHIVLFIATLTAGLVLLVADECPAEFSLQVDNTLEEEIESVETQSRLLANAFANSFNSRCSKLENCECSHWKCSDSVGQLECSTYGGSTRPSVCASDSTCDAISVNFQQSAAYWPGEGQMDRLQKELLCGTTDIDQAFRDVENRLPGMLYAYFGAYNGVYREYPGSIFQCGSGYDPRIRPWYRAGSTGPKDVVIVVDRSGSMGQPSGTKTRWRLVQEALGLPNPDGGSAYGLLDAFGHTDYIQVVTFSEDTETFNPDGTGDYTRLVRGTRDNIEDMKEWFNGLSEQTKTFSRKGFDKAFEILRQSGEVSSKCKRIILYLTDGDDSFCGADRDVGACGQEEDQTLAPVVSGACRCHKAFLDQIEQWQTGLETQGLERASIFTFSMSADADDSLPKQIACRNEGAWGRISDADDPLTAMNTFFSFLARNAAEGQVYWSEPFKDWTTDAVLSAAVSPVVSKGLLVGVVAIDVKPEVLASQFKNGQDINELATTLQGRSRFCNSKQLDLDACELQMLRFGQQSGTVDRQMTCPADLSESTACCFVGKDTGKRFMVVDEPRTWDDAQAWCAATGGKLATIGAGHDEDLHMLAGIAPPDGAWVGLEKTGAGVWAYRDGATVTNSDARIWSSTREPQEANEAAFISPRGSTGNHKTFKKAERMSFVCEYTTCPTANCSSGRSGEVDDSAASVQTTDECQSTTETFIQACPATAEVAQSDALCAPQSSQPWSARGQALCCARSPEATAAGDDDDGGSNMGGIIGGVVGGLAGVGVVGAVVYVMAIKGKGAAAKPVAPPAVNPNLANNQPAASGPPMPAGFDPDPPPPPYQP